MPHYTTITLEDIAEVAQSFNCDFDSECHREVLQCRTCRDIQACPGSGKTTLLVAKLAILAKKWKWRDRGICVLSHTNVARQEVEKRLGAHPVARQLLGYPHFIGTIQVFVDQFLALPFLHSQGIDVVAVGDDRFASRVWNLVDNYYYLRAFLKQKPKVASAILPGLRYEGANLRLGSAGGPIPVGPDTPTYGELLKLKKRIYQEGILRYDDMYALAEAYLSECPCLPEIMSERFPWVFVDEMQDTNPVQENLLNRLFSDSSIVQRFGDINQAIFGEASSVESSVYFPLPGAVSISQSKRFGRCIAAKASTITAVEYQQIDGDPNCKDQPHTIFLFNADTISKVLPAYGDLLVEVYPEGMSGEWPVKAIGYRKSPPADGSARTIPYNVGDYWQHFQPSATSRSARPDHLIGFMNEARLALMRRCEWREAYDLLIEGVVEFLQKQGATDDSGLKFTKARLIDVLRERGENEILKFRELLLDCGIGPVLDRECWQLIGSSLSNLMSPWCGSTISCDALEFLQWIDVNAIEDSAKAGVLIDPSLINTFRFESANGVTVDIEVTTIHAVKGETHLATLVLETFWYGYDLQEMIPFMIGQGDRKLFSTKDRTRERAKRIFVGMTRPKELLCLAICKDHLEEKQINALVDSGWTIRDLTVLSKQ